MARIGVKQTVQPRSLTIMAAVANVAKTLVRPDVVVITSANDSRHMVGSKHYRGEALDVRSKNFPNREAKLHFLADVLRRLGPGYEGLLEAEGTPNEHFHLEWDPRPQPPPPVQPG